MIQVIDSIPWVRYAFGNVFSITGAVELEVGIKLLSSSARVTSVKSAKGLLTV